MRTIILFATLALFSLTAHAQTGIGTPSPHPSAQLHIKAEDKGVLIPQVTLKSLTDVESIEGEEPAESLLIFNPDGEHVAIGYYYWLGSKWEYLASDSNTYANVHYDITKNQFFYKKDDGTEVQLKAMMPEFFYMPTVLFDTSNPDPDEEVEYKLHEAYVDQFKNPKASSENAPAIPHLTEATDFHYYITDYDEDVIEIVSISEGGVVKYKVKNNANAYSFMTVIFVVKKPE